jgi:hypothetical protein
LTAFGLTRHQYYYRPQTNGEGCFSRPGTKASTHTDHFDAQGNLSRRTNEEVMGKIKDVHADDDLRCGYKRMSAQLELQGYRINNKKVYRLMKEEDLLLDRRRSERGPYVTHRCARPDWGKGKITARKNKREKLIFKLPVPRYLLTRTLKLEAEVPANEQANTKPAAPQANAPKQQNPTPAVC